MRVFLTGAAGFIGFHTAKTLLQDGHSVLGFDNLNDYYDPKHKDVRLEVLRQFSNFSFVKGHLEDEQGLRTAWTGYEPSHVLHLAAQAGVRYSIENPMAYIKANVVGFQNVIDLVRHTNPTNFVYASSSSVYGGNRQLPFSENQAVDKPISLYASTKIANELVARTYNHLFKIPSTGLRFFTVYGPYSRPDMAMFKFAEMMRHNQPLPVFNQGKMVRDFTFIDDIVQGIRAALDRPQAAKIYNLGRGNRENLMDMIVTLEKSLGYKAQLNFLPLQPGDVEETSADISLAQTEIGYHPKTDLSNGLPIFANWYKEEYLARKG